MPVHHSTPPERLLASWVTCFRRDELPNNLTKMRMKNTPTNNEMNTEPVGIQDYVTAHSGKAMSENCFRCSMVLQSWGNDTTKTLITDFVEHETPIIANDEPKMAPWPLPAVVSHTKNPPGDQNASQSLFSCMLHWQNSGDYPSSKNYFKAALIPSIKDTITVTFI